MLAVTALVPAACHGFGSPCSTHEGGLVLARAVLYAAEADLHCSRELLTVTAATGADLASMGATHVARGCSLLASYRCLPEPNTETCRANDRTCELLGCGPSYSEPQVHAGEKCPSYK